MPTGARARGLHRLTDKALRSWVQRTGGPTNGSDVLHDGGGLYLRRRSDGAFWALREVDPVTRARTWTGLFPGVSYPEASLEQARRRADAARLAAADRPTTVQRERAAALAAQRAADEAAVAATRRCVTVRQLFERWAETDLAPRVSADGTRTGRKDGGDYTLAQFKRRLFPALGTVPAATVSRADLLAILDKVKGEGRLRTANVLLADLKQMFRFALERELIERHPLEGITRRQVGGKETERDRTLTAAELRQLADAVPAARLGKRSEVAVWLVLSTGCRVGEAMGARWEAVDTVARTWHLPVTKNEREHVIHLSDFALRQFEALAAVRSSGPDGRPSAWVFPNATGTGPVDVKSFGKQLADRQRPAERRLRGRSRHTASLELPGGRWTPHDLRRTAATMMAELGVRSDVIDECLNHVIESRVRRTYIRDRRLAEQARAFDALGQRLDALTGRVSPARVLAFPVAA